MSTPHSFVLARISVVEVFGVEVERLTVKATPLGFLPRLRTCALIARSPLVVATTVVSSVAAASVGPAWTMAITLAVLVAGGLITSTADPRVATTGAVYASLFLPLGVLSGWNSDMWAFLIVFGIAFALAAATSQVGMRRLARI